MARLKQHFGKVLPEAGCDEAGRGCLAGPVVAAAVIFPGDLDKELRSGLRDSKQLSPSERQHLRQCILGQAVSHGIAFVSHHQVDKINILNASIMAMHEAIRQLNPQPATLLIDGNRFAAYGSLPHHCIVRGDSLYLTIAAASILAKTARDEYMRQLHESYPQYHWDKNKGYPTRAHREAIARHGLSPHHRRSFRYQLSLRLHDLPEASPGGGA